jgi:hypothetical protein
MERATEAGARVVPDATLAESLRGAGIAANLRFAAEAGDIVFVERQAGGRRLFFVHNGGKDRRDASFEVPFSGAAERWDAMTGEVEALPAEPRGSGLKVPLQLDAGTSALIVIDPAKRLSKDAAMAISASFELPRTGWSFSASGHGMAGSILERDLPDVALGDWAAFGLDRFAGTGRYQHSFELPANWLGGGRRVELTLAGVHDMAEVRINGHAMRPLISAPWTLDVTPALRNGSNRIEIAVSNVPQNAMIDPAKPAFAKLAPVPAGLHGPVKFQLLKKAPRR